MSGTEPFVRVDVTPDTDDWLAARRRTLGASDVPAVLGLSPHATPLDVYNAKHGLDRDMDPELAFIGHAEEYTVGKWLRRFHPELGQIRRGFMARSVEAPWLHASFDRFAVKRSVWAPVQIKTAHQYAGQEWSDGVPLPVAAQIQTELFVHGSDHGWAVGFVGGRRFELHRVDRDEEFIRDVLIPQTRAFWEEHVEAHVPPAPTTSGEAVSLWPGDPDTEITADDYLLELLGRYAAAKERADVEAESAAGWRLEIQKRMQDASVLLDPMGTPIATWKPKHGAARIDSKRLRTDHPDLADAYTVHAADGRQFLLKTPKGSPHVQ